jgi:hypothetical protein
MIAGPLELTSPINNQQLMREFTAHSMGVDILAARYGATSQFKDQFNKHYEALRMQHVHKAGIFEAFFRGLGHAPKLTDEQKTVLVENYAAYKNITPQESESKLKGGLAPFTIPDELDCGFFQRVNADALRGRMVAVKRDDRPKPDLLGIFESSTMYWVYRSFDMHVVSWGGMGCGDNSLTVRTTISLPEKDLFRFYDNMHNMREYFFGEKPELQLDFFRETYPLAVPAKP